MSFPSPFCVASILFSAASAMGGGNGVVSRVGPWSTTFIPNMGRGIAKVLFTWSATATATSSTAPPTTPSHFSSSSSSLTGKAAAAPKLSSDAAGHPRLSSEAELSSRRSGLRFQSVPSSRTGRAASFGALFFQLGWERVRSGGGGGERMMLSEAGHERIVETLCRMRGAVLKLGQMLSIQDEHTVPSHVTRIFQRVRDQAFAMPHRQLEATLGKEFGDPNYRVTILSELEEIPVAAASIGQVHRARLHITPSPVSEEKGASGAEPGPEVAIKIQYPGVAQSIDSDIHNLRLLLKMGVMPPGMFVEKILEELRGELMEECQYLLEAEKQQRFRSLLVSTPALASFFHVPRVYSEWTTNQMIVTEYVRGVPIDRLSALVDKKKGGLGTTSTNHHGGGGAMSPDGASLDHISADYTNYVASQFLLLTLHELFLWRFMQTDPNFSNFLFDVERNCVHLLDFGAARAYPHGFVAEYLEVVAAAARQDREEVIRRSISLGFLTGREGREMMDAHVESVMLLGKPFRHRDRPFDFGEENLPSQVQRLVPTMVKLRLKPPPTPAYSLHRRLSGTILLATRLRATLESGKLFWDVYEAYHTQERERKQQQQVGSASSADHK